MTPKTAGHQVKIEASIGGVADLFLVVNDGGDGFTCDWADWIIPTVSGPAGTRSLVDMKWESASSQFGKVQKNANCRGNVCSVDGNLVDGKAIGTHANSTIHFQLPKGYSKFTAIGALDSGGTSQAAGGNASVQFAVYAGTPPQDKQVATEDQQREPANALSGIEVADGLQATLSASEPELRSLTNLDVDDRGRVWVCDVMNYRKNNGSRPEGDRILILEDTTGDGVLDSRKVFIEGLNLVSGMEVGFGGVWVGAAPYLISFDFVTTIVGHDVGSAVRTGGVGVGLFLVVRFGPHSGPYVASRSGSFKYSIKTARSLGVIPLTLPAWPRSWGLMRLRRSCASRRS